MTNSYVKLLQVVGNNVRKYRKKANLTQTQIAIRLEKTKEYIYMIEKGMRAPSLKTLTKMADALNISIEDLICDSKSRS